MLKVIDDGVVIELNGSDKNPLFWAACALVVVAMAVAVVAFTMPTNITIGAMAVLAVLVFVFNLYKQKQKTQTYITSGKLIVKRQEFMAQGHVVKLSTNAIIERQGDGLMVADLGRVWQLSGFDNQKELMVAQSVLEGKALQKQERAIRLL